jgi:hypothetical protein
VGGETIVSDTALRDVAAAYPGLHFAGATAGAVPVLLFGKKPQKRHAQ